MGARGVTLYMRIFWRLFWAFVFFSLFAFALNNQQTVALHWFFGYAWTAPMVLVVLAVFTLGIIVGVLAMTPSWWRHRRLARQKSAAPDPSSVTAGAPTSVATTPVPPSDAYANGI